MNTSFIDDSTYFIVPVDCSYEGFQRRPAYTASVKTRVVFCLLLALLPITGTIFIVYSGLQFTGWMLWIIFLTIISVVGLTRNRQKNSHASISPHSLNKSFSVFLFDSGFIINDDYLTYSDIPVSDRDKILSKLYSQITPYDALSSVSETDKDFYFFMLQYGGLTIEKEDCSSNALHFLSTLKNNTSKSKNSFAEDNRQTANTQDLPLKSSSPQMGSENSIPRTDIPDIGLVDDTNYFLIPIDTSAEGFCRSVSATLPMWWKIAVGLYVPVSLILAVFCTAEKEYELCIFLWIILSVLILLVLGYRPILKLLHNSNELLQKKHSIFLFDSGYTVSGIYLAYSDIPAGQRNRKLNSLYTHKLPYTTLYGLHESKGYYYISVTYNTVYAIRKSDCSPNAQAFLRNLKTAVDSQKR
ncbi:hypothetical protein [Scardovia wiggsiae]|uniref:hypothetical protein n=1 Tax=Scardovia wiggsiae TaxID=230143 RepID=UPI00374E902B